MKTVLKILCAIAFVAGNMHPFTAHATSIGISPASIHATVLQGTTEEIIFNLSRSDVVGGQMVFSGEVEGDQILQIPQDAPIVIPAGFTDYSVPVMIDARQAPVGSYETTVRFVQVPDFVDAGSVKILIGAGVSVRVDVVSRADYLAYLKDSVFQDILLDVPEGIQAKSMAAMTASVRNNDSIPLGGFTYRYSVVDTEGRMMVEERAGERLDPYEMETQNVPFSFRKDGVYTAELQVLLGEDVITRTQRSFTVLPADPIKWFPFITACTLLFFGGWSVYLCYRKKG